MPKHKWLKPGPKIETPNGTYFKSKLWGCSTLQLQQITGIKCRTIHRWQRRLQVGDSLGIVKRQRKPPRFSLVEKRK